VQEKLGYSALLILLEWSTINICAADIFWKVISLQLKGYTSTDWQFHVAQILLHSHSHNLLSITYPFLRSLALSYNSQKLYSCRIFHHIQQGIGAIPCNIYCYLCRGFFHFLSNVCSPTITDSNQHLCSERNLI
jgi:hypothetical protein